MTAQQTPPAKGGEKERKLPTHYAPAERKAGADLQADIERVTANPIIDGVMTVANGLLAVLNEQRQVVALNHAFLKQIGIDDPAQALGLRVGESLHCRHACEMEGGCGTSQYCSTCGAAIAMVAALQTGHPQERSCALAVEKNLQQIDLYFNIRTYPIEVEEEKYLLLFMQDITMQQHRACLDRTFYHDINNILCGLIGKSRVFPPNEIPTRGKMQDIQHLVMRIAQEISIHNSLQNSVEMSYKPIYAHVPANALLKEIDQLFTDHRLSVGKKLAVRYASDDLSLTTDFHLASRVLINMVSNALEATGEDGTATLHCTHDGTSVTFHVWNEGEIPGEVALRIFQLNFSTKAAMGRGYGTYSMRYFGEKILGGKVKFESGHETGTTFSFTLPTR